MGRWDGDEPWARKRQGKKKKKLKNTRCPMQMAAREYNRLTAGGNTDMEKSRGTDEGLVRRVHQHEVRRTAHRRGGFSSTAGFRREREASQKSTWTKGGQQVVGEVPVGRKRREQLMHEVPFFAPVGS